MANFEKIENIRDIRRNLGLNQMEFWSKLGVTQSGGSRYESGRNMPKPVRELLRIVHIERVDLSSINASDLAVASLLKERDPELYEQLLSDKKYRQNKKAHDCDHDAVRHHDYTMRFNNITVFFNNMWFFPI